MPIAKPTGRPNGSGAGIGALNADTGATEVINYVRSSRLPSPAEQTAATTNGWGGLHVYQFATDGLEMAVSQKVATDAPTSLPLSVLVNIYQGTYLKWGDIPGYSGPACDRHDPPAASAVRLGNPQLLPGRPAGR